MPLFKDAPRFIDMLVIEVGWRRLGGENLDESEK